MDDTRPITYQTIWKILSGKKERVDYGDSKLWEKGDSRLWIPSFIRSTENNEGKLASLRSPDLLLSLNEFRYVDQSPPRLHLSLRDWCTKPEIPDLVWRKGGEFCEKVEPPPFYKFLIFNVKKRGKSSLDRLKYRVHNQSGPKFRGLEIEGVDICHYWRYFRRSCDESLESVP